MHAHLAKCLPDVKQNLKQNGRGMHDASGTVSAALLMLSATENFCGGVPMVMSVTKNSLLSSTALPRRCALWFALSKRRI